MQERHNCQDIRRHKLALPNFRENQTNQRKTFHKDFFFFFFGIIGHRKPHIILMNYRSNINFKRVNTVSESNKNTSKKDCGWEA